MKRLLVLAVVFLMMVGCKRCQECKCMNWTGPGMDQEYRIVDVCRDNFENNDDYKEMIERIEKRGLVHYKWTFNTLDTLFTDCECKPDILW